MDFGRLTVVQFVEVGPYGARWLCECSCSDRTRKTFNGNDLTRNRGTRSCGCLRTEIVDLTGLRFGRLLVVESAGRNAKNDAIWKCVCQPGCDKEVVVLGSKLTSGHTRSCGCLQKETVVLKNTTHGGRTKKLKHTKESRAHHNIITRCCCPTNKDYPNYGGRGIKICDRWMNSFADFLSDVGYAPSPKHSLDRIDVDGNYEPGNVKWSTWAEQSTNKRNTVYVEFRGEIVSLRLLADRFSLKRGLLFDRYQSGDTGEDLIRPPRAKRQNNTVGS